MPTMQHPTAAELTAFVLGQTDEAGSLLVEEHISECSECQRRAAEAPGDTLVELLRTAQTSLVAGAATPPALTMGETLGLGPVGTAGAASYPRELADHPRYRLIRPLGAGGMGTVWLAEHKVMNRQVALKVIRAEFLEKPGAAERFHREVQTVARLRHANIVAAHDAEQAGTTHLLVMEYVEGVSLAELLAKTGPLAIRDACRLIHDAALGLQHAHELGLVHRDIKPHNLMLATTGTVKILDFGLASVASESGQTGLTGANMVVGTPDYIAPEQAENARAADIRSDIYALGCTLYQLLTGQVPFPGDSVLKKLDAHRTREPAALRDHRPAVSAELTAVITRMMAKNPAHRYQTPADVATALAPFVAEIAPARRRRRPWAAVAAALLCTGLIAAAGVVFYIVTNNGTIEIRTDDENVKILAERNGERVTVLDPKSKQTWVVDTGEWTVRLDGNPDGLKIEMPNTFRLKRGDRQIVTIKRVQRAEQQAGAGKTDVEWTFHSDGLPVCAVAVSPNGRLVAAAGGFLRTQAGWAVAADLDVRLLDRETGKELRRFKGPKSYTMKVTFSPDGKSVAAAGGYNCAYVWDVDSGNLLHTLRGFHEKPPAGDMGTVTDVAFAPDGKRLLTTSWDTTIRLWDAESGKELGKLGAAPAAAWQVVAYLPGGKEAVVGGWSRLLVLDVETDKVARTFDWPGGRVNHISLSADGTRLLTTGADGTDQRPRLWDMATGKKLQEFDAKADWVAFLPDGRRFLLAGGKNFLLVDSETKAVLETFPGHGDRVQAAAPVPTAPYVVSGSFDQTVRLWRLPEPALEKEKVGAVRRFDEAKTVVVNPDRTAAEYVLALGGTVQVNNNEKRDLKAIAELPRGPFRLTNVDLKKNQRVSDTGLAAFKGCKNLDGLDLDDTHVSDAGLVHFKYCKKLRDLGLNDTLVSNAGLAHFKDCKNLEAISLYHTQVTDAGLAHFKDCTRLHTLGLGETQVGDAGLANFKDCLKLTNIWLNSTQVDDASLALLKDFKRLTSLSVQDTRVSNAGLAHLKGCKTLKILDVSATQVSDAGLKHLVGLTNLAELHLKKTKVTAAGIDEIKKALPKCTIDWDGGVAQP